MVIERALCGQIYAALSVSLTCGQGMLIASIGSVMVHQINSGHQEQLTAIVSLYFAGVAIGSLFAGWLGQRYGSRTVTLVSAAAVGAIYVGHTWRQQLQSAAELLGARLLLGVYFGAAFPSNNVFIRNTATPHRRGILSFSLEVHNVVFGVLTYWLSERWWWWKVTLVIGGAASLLTVLTMITLPSDPVWLSEQLKKSENRLHRILTDKSNTTGMNDCSEARVDNIKSKSAEKFTHGQAKCDVSGHLKNENREINPQKHNSTAQHIVIQEQKNYAKTYQKLRTSVLFYHGRLAEKKLQQAFDMNREIVNKCSHRQQPTSKHSETLSLGRYLHEVFVKRRRRYALPLLLATGHLIMNVFGGGATLQNYTVVFMNGISQQHQQCNALISPHEQTQHNISHQEKQYNNSSPAYKHAEQINNTLCDNTQKRELNNFSEHRRRVEYEGQFGQENDLHWSWRNPYILSLMTVCARVPAMVVSPLLVDRLHRRTISFICSGGMAIIYLTLCLINTIPTASNGGLLLPLTAVGLFTCIALFTLGSATLTWTVISELSPACCRHVHNGLLVTLWAVLSVLQTQTFPWLMTAVGGGAGVFAVWSAVCVTHVAFVYLFMPETGRLSGEQLDNLFINAAAGEQQPNDDQREYSGERACPRLVSYKETENNI